MANEEVLLNGLTYIENLYNIPTTASPTVIGVPTNLLSMSLLFFADFTLNGNHDKTNQYFHELNNTIDIPKTFDEFLDGYISHTGISGTNNFTGQPWIASFMDDWSSANHDPFASSTNVNSPWVNYFNGNTGAPTQTSNSDWPLTVPAGIEIITQFKAWFASFLTNFPVNAAYGLVRGDDNITSTDATNAFTERMSLSLSNVVTLTANKAGLAYRAGVLTPFVAFGAPLISYQDVYNALFPGAGTVAFTARLQSFYDEQVADKGYFIPSEAFSIWTNQLQAEFLAVLNMSGNFVNLETSLASAGFKKTLILDRIFLLVSKLLESLQRVAAVQAQRLTILTQWQAAYTNQLSQLPLFISSQTPVTPVTEGSGDSPTVKTQKSDARNELNNTINFSMRDLMQTRRNTIADTAKGLQSNINQTTDAVSQQANVATAIIQELTTLLSAIFR